MVLIYIKIKFFIRKNEILLNIYVIGSAYAAGKNPGLSFPILPNNQLSSCCCFGSILRQAKIII